jgi:hypothetical protein
MAKKRNKPIKIRRTWGINPTTKILGDKREKIDKKETDKEIKEMGCA